MKYVLTPVLYDFKRSFIRLSTLLLLVLFIVGGVGLSYLAYSFFVQQLRPVNTCTTIVLSNGTALVRGIVYDVSGNLLDKATIKIYRVDTNEVLFEKEVSGNFSFTSNDLYDKLFKLIRSSSQQVSLAIRIEASVGEVEYPITSIDNVVDSSYRVNSTILTFLGGQFVSFNPLSSTSGERGYSEELREYVIRGYFHLILLSKKTGDARLVVYVFNYTSPSRVVEGFLEYNVTKSETVIPSITTSIHMQIIGSVENLTFKPIGRINSFARIFELELPMDKDLLILKLSLDRGESNFSYVGWINYEFLIPVENRYVQVLSGGTGLSLFSQFFPIVFLYLAYVLMAKPRSTGALEFILARPITRWDIYVTRYFAGVLVAFVSTALFTLAINVSNLVLLGLTLDLWSSILVYLGLTASLIAFYTLCYMLASSLRSGMYLATSIVLFFIFSLFWNVIVLLYTATVGGGFANYMENSYLLGYFNPLSPISYALYYIQYNYGLTQEIPTVNPVATVLAPTLWITILFTIGYMIFKKINITT